MAEAARKSAAAGDTRRTGAAQRAGEPRRAVPPTPAQAARSYEDFLGIEDADPALRAQACAAWATCGWARPKRWWRATVRTALPRGYRGAGGGRVPPAARGAAGLRWRRTPCSTSWPALSSTPATPAGAFRTLDRLVAAYPHSGYYAEAQFRRGEGVLQRTALRRCRARVRGGAGRGIELAVRAAGPVQARLVTVQAGPGRGEQRRVPVAARHVAACDRGSCDRPPNSRARSRNSRTTPCGRSRSRLPPRRVPTRCRRRSGAMDRRPTNRGCMRRSATCTSRRSAIQDGAEAYRAFARRQPMDPQAPLLLVRATDAYAKGGFASLVLDGKRQLVAEYGPGSAYWTSAGRCDRPGRRARPCRPVCSISPSTTTRWRRRAALRPIETRRCAGTAPTWRASTIRRRLPARACCSRTCCSKARRFEEAAVEYERAAYGYSANPDGWPRGVRGARRLRRGGGPGAGVGRAELAGRAIESSLRFADTFPGARRDSGRAHADLQGAVRCEATGCAAESVAQRVLALGPPDRCRTAARRVDGARAHLLRLGTLRGSGGRVRRARESPAGRGSAAWRSDRAPRGVRVPPGRGQAGRWRRAGRRR